MSFTIPGWVAPVTSSGVLNDQSTTDETQLTVAATGALIPVVYGEQWVGGKVFAYAYSAGTWTIGALFCIGEIDSFVTLHLDNAAPVAGVTVNSYTGTTSQTANALLAAAKPGYTDTLVVSTPRGSIGVAYVVIQFSDTHYKAWPSITARIRGRKVEPISQNLLTRSETLDSYWTVGAASIVANAGVAPNGTTTADRLVPNTTSTASHYVRNSVMSVAVGDWVTISVYAKQDTGQPWLRIVSGSTVFAGYSWFFNLSTGVHQNTVGVSAAGGGKMIAVGNGWYRCIATFKCTTAGWLNANFYSHQGMETAFAGDGTSGPLLWGAQVVRGKDAGVYTATTTAAIANAYSDNPALCLRDLIRNPVFGAGDDTDDLAFSAAAAECNALVIAEKRRTVGVTLDSARPISEWIATLATYAGAWVYKRGEEWTARPDRPVKLWTFASGTESWTAANATLTQSGGALVVTTTAGTDTTLNVPTSGFYLAGTQESIVRARIRRTAGSSSWQGTLYYQTDFHGYAEAYKATAADPGVANGTWAIVQFDLANGASSVKDALDRLVTNLRFDFWVGATGEVWEIDWVSIGTVPITTASVVAGSMRVSSADTAQIPTVMIAKYTDTSVSPFRARDTAAVQLAGVSTGAVEWRESSVNLPGVTRYSQAIREATERLNKLQRVTQIECDLFDDFIALEQGDVVSVIHPFVGTGSAAENDASTLFRIIAPPQISPGKVHIQAVAYSASDFDNTESSTTWGSADAVIGRQPGAILGVNLYDNSGAALNELAVLNDYVVSKALSAVNANSYMDVVRYVSGAPRPAAWYRYATTASPGYVDPANPEIARIPSGMRFVNSAFRINPATSYEVIVRAAHPTASGSVQVHFNELDADLDSGIVTFSHPTGAFREGPVGQGTRATVVGTMALTTTYAVFAYTFTPAATAKWGCIEINCSSVAADVDWVVIRDASTRNTLTSGTASPSGGSDGDLYLETDLDNGTWWVKYAGAWVKAATIGADFNSNVSNIPYASIYANDDSVALGFNPTFSDWTTAYPAGWGAWAGAAPTKETSIVRVGKYAAKYTATGASLGMQREVSWTSSPMPVGTFVSGAVDFYMEAFTSGTPALLVRLWTNAAKTTYVDTLVYPTSPSILSQWQRVTWTARVGAAQQIYGMTLFCLASWGGTSPANFTGTVIFDNVRFAFYDKSTDNTTITINSNGTLSGAGSGAVTITGLGYSGDLNATYGATYGNDTGNISGLGGDGVNIVPPRFAGGFSRSDVDGKIPVSKQSGVDFCSVAPGNGTTGPTSGYYGLNALKISTLSTGTRRVYFATGASNYNVPIQAGCKWLVQAKVWANIAGDAKVGMRDNVSNTYRSVTRTIASGEIQAWQSLAGVVNMSTGTGSTATAVNIALEFLAGPGYCWFDGLMIERQVGPSTTPSPWRMPPTSQAYGALISATGVAPGTLQAGMAINQGDGTSRQLLSGLLQGTCRDGDVITFSPAFSDIPTVTFSPGAFSAVTGLTAPYYVKCEAKSLTATGFTASIRAVQQSGAQTLVTDTGGAAGATYDYEMDKSTATQAYDDKYIFTFNITIKNGEPEYGIYSSGNAKVHLYVALSSGVWTKVGNITVFGTPGASATTAVSGVVATSSVIDGLGQHAGKEFAIDLGADLYGGSAITAFSSVKYYTATAPTEVSATSTTSAGVPFTVIGTVAGT